MTFLQMITPVETHKRKYGVNKYDTTKAYGVP